MHDAGRRVRMGLGRAERARIVVVACPDMCSIAAIAAIYRGIDDLPTKFGHTLSHRLRVLLLGGPRGKSNARK